jgi:hypothetical protein
MLPKALGWGPRIVPDVGVSLARINAVQLAAQIGSRVLVRLIDSGWEIELIGESQHGGARRKLEGRKQKRRPDRGGCSRPTPKFGKGGCGGSQPAKPQVQDRGPASRLIRTLVYWF